MMGKVKVLWLFCAALSAFVLSADEEMVSARVDFTRPAGPMKAVHGVNNAPMRLRNPDTAKIWEYEEAGIPYMRTHDTYGAWGGTHFVDVPNVFPDFGADENDPKSYDFAFTDAYLKSVVSAGTKIYYRLGVTIENNWRVKAYNIHPPKDYAKWARICEHIVRHYNEGWANGFKWGIEYWEIWNEPENPPMWTGTRAQFFELYRVAANHLKRCFPDIKVGGYGSCGFYATDDERLKSNAFQMSFISWFEEFCKFVTDEKTSAPLDFFSWHQYVQVTPRRIIAHADYVRKTLDSYGLKNTESHFNEWNYVGPEWDDFTSMLKARGAACVSEAFCLMQKGSVDKAMYYDARPNSQYGGLFHLRGKDRRSVTYFAFKLWNEVYKLGTSVESSADDADFGIAAAKAQDGRKAVFLVNNSAKARRVRLTLVGAGEGKMDVRLLDDSHSSEDVVLSGRIDEVSLSPYMVAVIETSGMYSAPAERKAAPKIFAGQDEAGAK